VQVLVDRRWLDGSLDTWHMRGDRWFGFVRY
jgi:hypothetical protein